MNPLAARLAVGCSALAIVAAPSVARAALTSSEKAQIVSYVVEGHVATAPRVRALVARPDLTIDESAAALEAALAPVVFNDARGAYLHEMLYGSASLASRSVVAVAITRALAARADGLVTKHEGDLDQDAASIAELARLFGFIDVDIANAGQPHGVSHDPNAGISTSGYDDAARALVQQIERHPRWLKGDAVIPAAAAPARAQLDLAILDMTNDTTTRRFDAADRMGLAGPRRAALTESGVLLLDDGHADAARIEAARSMLARLPGAREGVEAIAFLDAKAPLRARAAVLVARAPIDHAQGGRAVTPFGEEVVAPPIDPWLASLARDLAEVAVQRALDVRPELREQSDKDAAAAKGDPERSLGAPAASATSALASAVQLLALDGPDAIELAMVRLIGGRPEPTALLSDALGALAAFAPPAPGGLSIPLGHARSDGGTSVQPIANVRVAPAGFVTGFTLAGHAWTLTRDDAGAIAAKRDGALVTLAMLANARAPVTSGSVWQSGGVVFAKMAGAPRGGVSAGGRVRIAGTGPKDAIATAAPGDDVAVEGDASPEGETALLVRAIATPSGFKGAGLVLDASTSPPRASLRAWDDAGKATELAPPAALTASAKYAVKLAVKGTKLEAHVGAVTLTAEVPASLAHGDVALAALKKGATLEMNGWALKKP